MMERSHEQIKGITMMLTATMLWGSSFAVTKGVVDILSPLWLVSLQMLLSVAFMLALAAKELQHINVKIVFCGCILGALYGVGMLLQTMAVKYTDAGRAAFLTQFYCVLMPFAEWLLLKRKKGAESFASAFVCLIGVGFTALSAGGEVFYGDVLAILCSIFFCASILLTDYLVKTMSGVLLNLFLFLSAGVGILIVSLVTEGAQPLPTRSVPGVLYLGIICSGLPLFLQTSAQRVLSPTMITIVHGFQPVFAAICSALIWHESFSFRTLVGFVLIVVSVLLNSLPRHQAM